MAGGWGEREREREIEEEEEEEEEQRESQRESERVQYRMKIIHLTWNNSLIIKNIVSYTHLRNLYNNVQEQEHE